MLQTRGKRSAVDGICMGSYCIAARLHGIRKQFCQTCGLEACNSRLCTGFVAPRIDRNVDFLRREYVVAGRVPSSPEKSVHDPVTHAMVFTLADRYMVNGLRELSLHKLHRELCLTILNDSKIGPICDLISFVHGQIGGESMQEDSLQILVLGYMVFEAKKFLSSEVFQRQCMGLGGRFITEFAVKAFTTGTR
jgi:hypothetical protein